MLGFSKPAEDPVLPTAVTGPGKGMMTINNFYRSLHHPLPPVDNNNHCPTLPPHLPASGDRGAVLVKLA